jgi:hypothetical protein
MTRLCQEWGRRNNVEVQIDYIISAGFKGIVTAAAEAQAGAGHDIFAHPTWQVSIHRHVLEPMDDVMAALEKENGAGDEVVRYFAKFGNHWYAVPAVPGSQVKPCCSRFDLYRQHCGMDLRKIFPASDQRDKALTDTWNWDLYLSTAEKLMKAGHARRRASAAGSACRRRCLDLRAAGAASDAPGSHPPAHGARHRGFDPEQPGLSAGTEFTNGDAPSVALREKAHE